MTGAGWMWLYIGAGLMMLEVVSSGFVVFFFGLAAATVGLMRFCIGEEFTLTWQLVSFSALCVAYIALFRPKIHRSAPSCRLSSAGRRQRPENVCSGAPAGASELNPR